MNSQEAPVGPGALPQPFTSPIAVVSSAPSKKRAALHIALFLVTLCSTTVVGVAFAAAFQQNRSTDGVTFALLEQIARRPELLLQGLPFSLTLLVILLAHEMGHYLACVYYHVDASLPYFLPAPTIIGTFGAFIRIRSHILKRKILFDIGIAGPLAGFVLLAPALAVGVALSKVVPGAGHRGELIFGTPLVLRALESCIFPGTPTQDLLLHPIARGAWVGVFATALNLLPIGQLDGGHILYALLGDRHQTFSNLFLLLLIPLGFLYTPWWAWAVAIFLFGRRHPFLYDPDQLDTGRRKLGWVALAVFFISFMPEPIHLGLSF